MNNLEEELIAMAPLAEEGDVPPLETRFRTQSDPTHRRLQAIAGAGNAYVLIVINPTTDETTIDFNGVHPEDVSLALRHVADLVGADQ